MNSEFLNNLNESFSSFFTGWDPAIASGVCAAIALVGIWMFVRVVRTVSIVAFTLCVVYLVLKAGFDVDLLNYLDFKPKTQETVPAAAPAEELPLAY